VLPARWYDGQRALGQPVELSLAGEELQVALPAGGQRRYARRSVTWPERTRHGVRQLLLPDGGVIELPDASAWDAWAQRHGLAEPLAVRWAASWRTAMWSAVGLVLLLAGAGVWGVPWVAERAAPLVPQAARAHIDRLVLTQLRNQGWLQPSKLPPDTTERLRAEVDRMLAAAYPDGKRPRVQVDIHGLPGWMGPNAFALPGGQIVISDALLALLPAQGEGFHPGVLGVLAHEVGHVKGEHGLRNLLASSSTAALLGWWIGDYSSVLAAAPALLIQAGYSRAFEREADDEALRIMRAAGVDARGMVAFFAALKQRYPERGQDMPNFGLATHPPDDERARLFGTGSR
jgi:Zn-dependent protease with chaperone function